MSTPSAAARGPAWLQWLRYDREPAFSRRWVRKRALVCGLLIMLVLLLKLNLLSLACLTPRQWADAGLLANVWVLREMLMFVAVLMLGPSLAGWLLRRPALARRPVTAVTVGLATGFVLMTLVDVGVTGSLYFWFVGVVKPEALFGHGTCRIQLAVASTPEAVMMVLAAGPVAWWRWRRAQQREVALQRQAQAVRSALEQRRSIEARAALLAAQLEPHFLFNALTGLEAAIERDPPRALAFVTHLRGFMQRAAPLLVPDAARSAAPLRQELDLMRDYLDVMRLRMPRLSFVFEVNPAAVERLVMPLLLLPVIENAVRHGVEPTTRPVTVRISARVVEADQLLLSVEDDGAGLREGAVGAGVGLRNLQQRLRLFYGPQAQLDLSSSPKGGTAVSIRVPLAIGDHRPTVEVTA